MAELPPKLKRFAKLLEQLDSQGLIIESKRCGERVYALTPAGVPVAEKLFGFVPLTESTPTVCPNCGHISTNKTNPDGGDPAGPGDVYICLKCGLISQFGPKMILSPLSADELQQMSKESSELFADLMAIKGMVDKYRRRCRA